MLNKRWDSTQPLLFVYREIKLAGLKVTLPYHTIAFTWQSTITRHLSMLIPRLCGVTDKEYLVPHSPHQRNRCLSSLTSEVRGVRGHDKQSCSHTSADMTRSAWTDPQHARKIMHAWADVFTRAHTYGFWGSYACTAESMHSHRPFPPPAPFAAVVSQAKPSESPFNEVRR